MGSRETGEALPIGWNSGKGRGLGGIGRDFRNRELTGNQSGRYAEISEQLGISELALRAETSRMRRRFARILKAEVARTAADSDCINQEVLYILNLLRERD